MFSKISASSLHVSKDSHWLESRFHFSFAGYHDDKRTNFGVLRVVNDDLVIPEEGFGTHPHRDMEIVTYVIDGELTHKDSMGTEETLSRGCVQYMSAGTGITHSEYNANKSDMLRFLQIWILPDKKGHKPRYGSKRFTLQDRLNKIHHLVGEDTGAEVPYIPLHQDANFFVTELEPGHSVPFVLKPSRQIYAVCIEGSISFSTQRKGENVVMSEDIAIRDGLEIRNRETDPVELYISAPATTTGHLLMIEMALSP